MKESEVIELKSKLFNDMVIEAFIYRAMEAVHEALNSKFTISLSSKKATEEYISEINHLFGFIEEERIIHTELLKSAHQRYVKWANQYKLNAFGVKEFLKKYMNALRAKGYETNRIIDDSKEGISRHRIVIRKEGDIDE